MVEKKRREKKHVAWLRRLGVCEESLSFAARYPTLAKAWAELEALEVLEQHEDKYFAVAQRSSWLAWISKLLLRRSMPKEDRLAAWPLLGVGLEGWFSANPYSREYARLLVFHHAKKAGVR